MAGFFGAFFGGGTGGGSPVPPTPTPVLVPVLVRIPVVYGMLGYNDHVALAVDRLCGYAREKAIQP